MDKTAMAVALFDKLAGVYQEKYMNVDLYASTLHVFCETVATPNASVLEIACGPGNITRYLLSSRPDFQITATDLSPNMLLLAAANNPTAQFQLMDGRNIDQLDNEYDAIMCGFFLPYLSRDEVAIFIKNAAKVLRAGGVLYLSTMEDDYSKSGWQTSSSGDKLFIHYYQAEDLLYLLEVNGFELTDIQRKHSTNKTGTTVTDVVIIGKKKLDKQ